MLVHMVFRKFIISQARNKAINCPAECGPDSTCIFIVCLLLDMMVAKFSSFYISRSIMLIFKTFLLNFLGELQGFFWKIDTEEIVKSKTFPQLTVTMWKHFINSETTQHCNPDESHGHWSGDSVSWGS